MVAATTVDRPAAGPETAREAPLTKPVTIPPIMPASKPAYKGAPEANAMPRQSGSATKKTESPAARSCRHHMIR